MGRVEEIQQPTRERERKDREKTTER